MELKVESGELKVILVIFSIKYVQYGQLDTKENFKTTFHFQFSIFNSNKR